MIPYIRMVWVVAVAFWGHSAVAQVPNLVLISMDTTRTDALSCYGKPPDIRRSIPTVTPTLDRLAATGVRFQHFYAHAPTTLNSHTSMMTGQDPHQHGVPSNGYPYEGTGKTLAERLHAEGYQTVAVVGAAALNSEMGLNRGFDVYDDRMPIKQKHMFQDTAEGVVRRALQQVDDQNSAKPTFLFVHFFDPHGPLTPPAAYRSKFVDPASVGPLMTQPWSRGAYMARVRSGLVTDEDRDLGAALYLAEVSYMDHQIGRLLEGLKARGFLDRALVVVTADHGQNLSENGRHAFSHGFDVHSEVLQVPLIIRGFGVSIPAGRVVRRRFSMSGLAPTLERTLGLQPSLGQGRDFYGALRPGPVWDTEGWPTRPQWLIPMEATRPYRSDPGGLWNNLKNQRALRLGEWTLYRSPRRKNKTQALRYTGPKGLEPMLRELLSDWDDSAPPFREHVMTLDTREALKALGYLEAN